MALAAGGMALAWAMGPGDRRKRRGGRGEHRPSRATSSATADGAVDAAGRPLTAGRSSMRSNAGGRDGARGGGQSRDVRSGSLAEVERVPILVDAAESADTARSEARAARETVEDDARVQRMLLIAATPPPGDAEGGASRPATGKGCADAATRALAAPGGARAQQATQATARSGRGRNGAPVAWVDMDEDEDGVGGATAARRPPAAKARPAGVVAPSPDGARSSMRPAGIPTGDDLD